MMYIIDNRWLVGGCHKAQEAQLRDDLEGWDGGGGRVRERGYMYTDS